MVVRMFDGEDLLNRLVGLQVDCAIVLCGIGMLRDVELGYWNGEIYEKHTIAEPVELVSLQGSIAVAENGPIVHVHACVAGRDGSTSGGHLFAGTVHNAAEIAVGLPEGIVLEREREETGLTGLRPRTT